jgi:FO synthase subunit 1
MSNIITYSPAYTIVPTYECFNLCTYCNFRQEQSNWLSLSEAKSLLLNLPTNTREILILSGEIHPASQRRQAWIQLIYDLGELAISLGFFPHTNVGPLSRQEMAYLKSVNFSMGLMWEQTTPQLLDTVHQYAPSKNPAVRLQQLIWAGELQIPFTTGLLLGIGENQQERMETLRAIASIQKEWGHIQEVILQPYCPGSRQINQALGFDQAMLPNLVSIAREILPANITIQIPPNLLSDETILLDCLKAGARDLGGICPLDEVNPDYHHSSVTSLKDFLAKHNWQLIPRLPIYPQYDYWLSPKLQTMIQR